MDMADFLDIDSSELALVEGVVPWPGSDAQQLGPPDMDDNYLNDTVLDLQHSTTEGRMLCWYKAQKLTLNLVTFWFKLKVSL